MAWGQPEGDAAGVADDPGGDPEQLVAQPGAGPAAAVRPAAPSAGGRRRPVLLVVLSVLVALVPAGVAQADPTAAGAPTAVVAGSPAPAAEGPGRPLPVGPTGGRLPVAADGEVVGLRTATSRTFLADRADAARGKAPAGTAGGSGLMTTRVYAGPVNFRDANGGWQKIDPTLVAKPGRGFVPTVARSRHP